MLCNFLIPDIFFKQILNKIIVNILFKIIDFSYFGSFEMDGVLMIEMEYADGGTLAEYLVGRKTKLLPEKQILEIFLQMSKAIQCIHQRNILHR